MIEILRPRPSAQFVASLALCGALAWWATGDAQSRSAQEITQSIGRALERLP